MENKEQSYLTQDPMAMSLLNQTQKRKREEISKAIQEMMEESQKTASKEEAVLETKKLQAAETRKITDTQRVSTPEDSNTETRTLETQKSSSLRQNLDETKKLTSPKQNTVKTRKLKTPKDIKKVEPTAPETKKIQPLKQSTLLTKKTKAQYNLVLNGDKARVWEALQYKVIKIEDVMWVLWFHFLSEEKQAPVLDLLYNQEMINENQYTALQKIEEKKIICEEKYTISKQDLNLGHYFVNCKIITQMGMEHLFTITDYFHELNINCSIDSLIAELQIASSHTVKQLTDEFNEKMQEGSLDTDITTFSQKTQKVNKNNSYTIIAIFLILSIVLAVIFAMKYIS